MNQLNMKTGVVVTNGDQIKKDEQNKLVELYNTYCVTCTTQCNECPIFTIPVKNMLY